MLLEDPEDEFTVVADAWLGVNASDDPADRPLMRALSIRQPQQSFPITSLLPVYGENSIRVAYRSAGPTARMFYSSAMRGENPLFRRHLAKGHYHLMATSRTNAVWSEIR